MAGHHDEDISLFPLLGKRRTRAAIEALLEKPRRQVALAKHLAMSEQALPPVIAELERAGVVTRDTPRGVLRVTHPKQMTKLLVDEAELSAEINAQKARRSVKRRRRLRRLQES